MIYVYNYTIKGDYMSDYGNTVSIEINSVYDIELCVTLWITYSYIGTGNNMKSTPIWPLNVHGACSPYSTLITQCI